MTRCDVESDLSLLRPCATPAKRLIFIDIGFRVGGVLFIVGYDEMARLGE